MESADSVRLFYALGHLLMGILFSAVGFWHLLCRLTAGAQARKHHSEVYSAHVYHRGMGCLKFWELYAGMAVTFSCVALVLFAYGSDVALIDLEHLRHVLLFSNYFLCAAFTLIVEQEGLKEFLDLPPGALHCVWGSLWFVSFMILHFHKQGGALEMKTHSLHTIPIAASMALMFLQVAYPHSFYLDLAAANALLLQGTWLIQMPFLLYVSGETEWEQLGYTNWSLFQCLGPQSSWAGQCEILHLVLVDWQELHLPCLGFAQRAKMLFGE